MPLVAAAMCPHPPLLVPAVAAGAAVELDDLRAACDAALAHLFAAEPRRVVIVGAGPSTEELWYPYHASFAPWGVPVVAGLGGPSPGAHPLPLSLTVGVWLVRRAIDDGLVRVPTTWSAFTVAADATTAQCAALGAGMRSSSTHALLVMGDGSACRGLTAPGYDDPRAEPFDKAVAQALATADADALLALDPALASELLAAGRAPWQVLAGAAEAATAADGEGWRGELRYEAAPYGVAYLVATWSRTPAPPPRPLPPRPLPRS